MADRLLGRREFFRFGAGLVLESGALALAIKKNSYGFVREALAQTASEVNVEGGVWKPGVNSVIWIDNERRTSDIKEVLDKIGAASDLGPRILWMLKEGEWKHYITTAGETSALKDIPAIASLRVDLAGPTAFPEKYPEYYKQYASAAGITIKAKEKVSAIAFEKARKTVLKMTSFRPDIRSKFINVGAYVVIVPKGDTPPSLPEFQFLRGQRDEGGRMYETPNGGLGGVKGFYPTAIPEDELIDPSPDRWRISPHEFAHHIGSVFSQREDDMLNSAYNKAKQDGYLNGDYAQNTAGEFWADHSSAWIDGDRRAIGRPEDILRRSPQIYNLLMEVYGPSLVIAKKS